MAMSELRTLLERFVNGKSMNIIFDTAHTLIDDTNMDEELRAWFKDLNSYVRKVYCLPSSPPSSPHINSLHAITRSSYKQVTSSNQTATPTATKSATPAADSTTGNTNPTSTTSSSLSGTGSKLCARTPRINDSGRIGYG